MLPKKVYNQVISGLKKIKADWDEDRAEDPNQVPYEIDSQLRSLIERCIQEGHVHCHGRDNREILVDQTINYLVEKGHVVGSPYGGVMFPLPEGSLPTKEEITRAVIRACMGRKD